MNMNSGQMMRRLKKQRAAWFWAYKPEGRPVSKGIKKAYFDTSNQISFVVMPGPASSSLPVSSALGEAALRALGSEQPRAVTPEEVYRMTPSPESTGWGKELAEDRENIAAENPWEGR